MYHKPVHRILNRHALPSARRMLHFPNLTRSRNDPCRQLQILPTLHDERHAPESILLALGRTVDERLGPVAAVVDRFVEFAHIEARDFCEAKVGQELVLALEAGVRVVGVGDADEVYFSRLAGRGGGGWRHVGQASRWYAKMGCLGSRMMFKGSTTCREGCLLSPTAFYHFQYADAAGNARVTPVEIVSKWPSSRRILGTLMESRIYTEALEAFVSHDGRINGTTCGWRTGIGCGVRLCF